VGTVGLKQRSLARLGDSGMGDIYRPDRNCGSKIYPSVCLYLLWFT